MFFAQDRVFDRVSGLDGIVLDATRENTIRAVAPRADSPQPTAPFQLPTAESVERYEIRLSNGQIVRRAAAELVKRPTPPAAA